MPLANVAQEWNPPALMATALVKPLTCTAVLASARVVGLFPNSPLSLRPQLFAVPFDNVAHECPPPAAIATTLPNGTTSPVKITTPTTTGTFEPTRVLLPNSPSVL